MGSGTAGLTFAPDPQPIVTRRLTDADTLLRLATVDDAGYPHVTPLWFLWDGEAICATSTRNAPMSPRLLADPRAGLLIDLEAQERSDGERPNRQFRAVADAELSLDHAGRMTNQITLTYLSGAARSAQAHQRTSAR